MAALQLEQLHITPHVVRHSAASNDRFERLRSIPEIKRRGLWAADASVKRYEKEALVIASLQHVAPELQALA
eukprot:4602984-Lingulodinium_polyedra.AAC.1